MRFASERGAGRPLKELVVRKRKQPIHEQSALITDQPARLDGIGRRLWAGCFLSRSHLTTLAVLWFFFAALELALNAVVPGSAARNDHLPLGARFFLICYSLSVLTPFLFLVGAFLKSAIWATERSIPLQSGARGIANGLGFFLMWLILLLYGASWATFWQIGTFVDSQAFLFLAPNPLQVFHWVEADSAVAVLVSTVVATFVVGCWLPRWAARREPTIKRRLVLAWSWALGFCMAGAFMGELYSGWGERRYVRSAILYAKSHDSTSGPFSYILADILRHARYRPEEEVKRDDIRILQRPITSMDQYLASTRRNKVTRWNVIILIVESLRADQLRVYGGGRDVMPVVDELAHEARVFLNAYTQSSHTNYATIVPLSSHYPLRSAISYTYPQHPKYPRVLMYDVLKGLGYRTAIFSSSNEYWGGMIHYLDTGNVDRFIHAANFKGPNYVMQDDAGFAVWVRETKHAGSIDDRYTVGEAIQWIDGLGSDPFFLSINFQNSHLPYPIPRDFPRRFGPSKLDFKIRFAHFPRDKIQVVKDIYADSLAYVDFQISRLVQYLKRRGMWDRTLIVVTGDHGQAFYEHGFASHASAIYNEVMKVPLVIRAPELPPSIERRPAQHVDIAPSVFALLGLPSHPSFQGINLFESQPNPNRSIYMVAQTPDAYQYGLVRSGFKLIYDERQREYLLYDLASDPGENSDIAASRPALVKEMGQRLHAWRKLQIDYYADEKLQTREYPPLLAD